MDVDAVIARTPELALVDELAHTNLPEARNRKRYEDIDEILEAGIDVTSTVNIQHLESLNDEVFELTGVRVRETFPDRILDEADEVVLVDLAPEALQDRLRGRQGLRAGPGRGRARRTSSGSTTSRRCASSSSASSPRTSRRAASTAVLDPLSQQAVAERILALVTPEPRSQRILRRAFRSGQRLGSEIDAVWVRRPGQQLTEAGDRLARRAAPAREHPRRALPRARGRQPARDGQALRRRARLDLRLRRHPRRVAADRDPPRLADLEARARPARRRHPRRRRPGAARGAATDELRAIVGAARRRRGRRRRRGLLPAGGRPPLASGAGAARILVPFTGGALDPTVLKAAIRIARAEDATLVPAYLIVVPLEQPEDAPMQQQVAVAMPLLEAVEHAALRAGRPGRRAHRERAHADPRPAAALGRRAVRPHRRSGAGRAPARLHAERPHLDAHARAERDADPPARPTRRGTGKGR